MMLQSPRRFGVSSVLLCCLVLSLVVPTCLASTKRDEAKISSAYASLPAFARLFLHPAVASKDVGDDWVLCETCQVVFDVIQGAVAQNYTVEDIAPLVDKICVLLKIDDATVCDGAVQEFGDEVFTIISERFLDPKEVCQHFLLCPENATTTADDEADRVVPLPLPEGLTPRVSGSMGTGTFFHWSDIHMDYLYEAGTQPLCGEPDCCRAANGPGNSSRWGDYHCDAPPLLVETLFAQAAADYANSPPDFILYTGDNPPHDIWMQTMENNMNTTYSVFRMLNKYFPNIPIYPAPGNHEAFPVDQFPIYSPDKDVVLDGIAKVYEDSCYLPQEAVQSLRGGGYYTMLMNISTAANISAASPPIPFVHTSIRMVSLNMQYCDINNFWLILNDTDPTGQLRWLDGVLSRALEAGEPVYIIGHIPPADSTCLYKYANQYRKIAIKYANIIVGQFFGHTHDEEFHILFSEGDGTEDSASFRNRSSTPLGVQIVAGSITPFTTINPQLRVFTYDRATAQLIDFDQSIASLQHSIDTDEPLTWTPLFSANEFFNTTSVGNASEWFAAANRLESDVDYFNEYWQYKYGNSSFHLPGSCDEDCRKQEICAMKSFTFKEAMECSNTTYTLSNLWDYLMNHLCS
eukprot:TRINITY_DN7499_c0_g1_i1.p1 TRINITY_DN7499_c0_g1~~TRINITY_DN7499_c0_g1_i1.p1  ORF type:complete len:633 (-),score=129.19 TRINITY_DN7499_c0_g1_i1:12-1910(-)